ncbi:serine/threonine-protein kinase [Streptomyces sp. NA04227]|uniref:serine/threonine-protein kinase n=1 Tax=Streptomyces sp. NA04227 TaxID=2742136 RepID=UPI0020CA5227|nr:serine/threonine-protein kinase [Streptomyces sp. NA04227]
MDVRGEIRAAAIGPFRPLAPLGQGGMGQVLLAAAPDGRLVAVKLVHEDLAEDEGFRERFRREVAISRQVAGVYTAPVVDADPQAPVPWLASAFVPGPSLARALEVTGPLPVEPVRQLAAGLAQALAEVHRAGLVHRDLKPSNVLLAEDGVRVIDFGIARAAEGQTKLTHTGAMVGSPLFMAPEQVRGEPPTAATDVFALGSTLVMASTGRSPFEAGSVPGILYKVAHEEPQLDGVPVELLPLVEACLARDPEARPTPAELLERIGPVSLGVRPWPGEVYRLLDEQRTEIAGLTSAAEAEAQARAQAAEATQGIGAGLGSVPGLVPGPGPVPPPPAVPPAVPASEVASSAGHPRRGGRFAAIATVAVVAAVALLLVLLEPWAGNGDDANDRADRGVQEGQSAGPSGSPTGEPSGGSSAAPEGPAPEESVPTPGTTPLSKVPDRYGRDLPECKGVNANLPVTAPDGFGPPAGNGLSDQDVGGQKHRESMCVWDSRVGDKLYVVWYSYASVPGGATGAEQAKENYETFYQTDGTAEGRLKDPGFAEEGFEAGAGVGDTNCVSHYRDVNMRMFVSVHGNTYPPGKCEAVATALAESAMAAVKRT